MCKQKQVLGMKQNVMRGMVCQMMRWMVLGGRLLRVNAKRDHLEQQLKHEQRRRLSLIPPPPLMPLQVCVQHVVEAAKIAAKLRQGLRKELRLPLLACAALRCSVRRLHCSCEA
jgi:hypothetical protein